MRFPLSHLRPAMARRVLVAAACCAFIGLLLFPGAASAQLLLLKGATVHTVSGETLTPGDVLVRDGRIEAVGKSLSAAGAKVIELKGQHLYPGIIALNTALGLTEIGAVRATQDTTEVGDYTPDVQSWLSVNPDSELIPVARANGITHAQPLPLGGIVSGQSGLIALEGWTMEQMTIKKPVALHLFWPSMELDTTPREKARDKEKWKSLEDQAKERRKRLQELDDFFAEARAYARAKDAAAKEKSPPPTPAPAWEAMLPVVRGELPVMVHADEVRQIRAAVSWAGTNKLNIILAGGRDAWMVADLLATNRIPVVYDNIFAQPARATDSYDTPFKAPELLRRAGVTVALGYGEGSSAATAVRNLPYAAAHAVAFGLPESEALKAIMLYPAQLLVVADRLGSIEPGKEATLFAADGNLLDVRANVTRMWIAGHEVSLESRHTRLYEKYKSRPRPAPQGR